MIGLSTMPTGVQMGQANMDLDKINVILATDCGSTTTKAILIEKVDGQFRQTY